jgi:hypothetical protein
MLHFPRANEEASIIRSLLLQDVDIDKEVKHGVMAGSKGGENSGYVEAFARE